MGTKRIDLALKFTQICVAQLLNYGHLKILLYSHTQFTFQSRTLSSSSVFASEMTSEPSQRNSKQSRGSNLVVNPDELANQVIEIDDPSQTLASSLHAVDIPSFVDSPSGVTSPSSNDRADRGGMETSFTSPVLGKLRSNVSNV